MPLDGIEAAAARTLYTVNLDWSNANVVVMGLGLFGGGEAAARFLASRGAKVLVTDLRSEESLAGPLGRLEQWLRSGDITTRLGGHNLADAATADILIVNPAVPHPWTNDFINAARSAGARIQTELRLAIGSTPAEQVIGITGTQGKSTTSAMVAHILHRTHPELSPRLGGNIGGSLLDDPPPSDASLILELSSFMLYWLSTDATPTQDRFTPGTAAITNLSPNHLDWHESFDHYAACKKAIARPTVGCESPHLVQPALDGVSEAIDSSLELSIRGEHNRLNATLAIRVALAHLALRGVIGHPSPDDAAACARQLSDFPGLPHRLFPLGTFGGVECIDDSKATTPSATAQAIDSFPDPSRIHLIAGGYDKGSDLTAIVDLSSRLGGLYAIGATGPVIASGGGTLCRTLSEAVASALARAAPGDVLLLSPGCASWDQFEHYESRGHAFAEAISQHFRS